MVNVDTDISTDIEIILNTLQSGSLDHAFLLHNKLLEGKLDYESQSYLDLVYSRLLLELGEYEKSHDILMNLCADKDKMKSELLRLGIDVYYSVAMTFTGRLDEAAQKILEIEKIVPKMQRINQLNADALLSEVYNVKGIIAFRNGEYNSATNFYEESLTISRKLNYRKDEGRTLFNLGSLFESIGELNQSMSTYMHALEIFESIKFYEGIMPTLNKLKNLNQRIGDENAVYLYDRKILDFNVFMDLRQCKISSSRKDFELNNQITSLIEERNNLEKKIWQLEFEMNSMKDGTVSISEELQARAIEENEALKERLERFGKEHEVILVELENVKNERDRLLEDLHDTVVVDDLRREIDEKRITISNLKEKIKKVENHKNELQNSSEVDKQELQNVRTELELLKHEQTDMVPNKQQIVIDELEAKLLSAKRENTDLRLKMQALEKIPDKTSELLHEVTKLKKQVGEISSKHDMEIHQLNQIREEEKKKLERQLDVKVEEEPKGEPDTLLVQELKQKNKELIEEIQRINSKVMSKELENQDLKIRLSQQSVKNSMEPTVAGKFQELEKENRELKERLNSLSTSDRDTSDLEIELKRKTNEYDNLVLEFKGYKENFNKERDAAIIEKDKEITRLQVKIAGLIEKEEVKDTQQRITQLSSSRITTKVEPIRQTIKPSEIYRKQHKPSEGTSMQRKVVRKIGKVYHQSLLGDRENLDEYLQSDRLAESIFETVTEMREIHLKFLAIRHGISPGKALEIVEALSKLGAMKIKYSEGDDTNPKISLKS